MKKRALFLLLAIAMLASAFAACSKEEIPETGKNETQLPESENSETTHADPNDRTAIDDGIGEYSFNGREFRIATTDYNQNNMDVEEISGETLNDAIYERNRRLEDRFDCTIRNIHVDAYDKLHNWMSNAVTADEDAFDLANQHVVLFGGTIADGYYMNLRDIEQIDFSRPWYSQSTTNEMTFNGKTYMAIGDMDLSTIGRTWCVIYDKVQAGAYNLPDLYGLVNKGEWTFDKSLELTGSIYEDLNGDGQKDNNDYYGYISNSGSAVNAYLWAFGEKILSVENGEIVNTYYTEKLTNIVQKLNDAFHGGGIQYDYNYVSPNGNAQYYGWEMYQKEKALMINGRIEYTLDYFRELENDYGVIPYPKYDTAQEEYYSMVDGGHCVLAVPVTVSDTEFVGVIFEALNADSYKYVVPEYYDTALRFKGLRDQESFDMLDMITNSRVFDMGYVHDNWEGASFIIQTLIENNNPNIASYWAANKKAIENHYDSVIDFYMEGEPGYVESVSDNPDTMEEERFTLNISTADEFVAFFNDLHSGLYATADMLVTLEADIDLNNQVLQTNPAGVFNGDFDGKGHKISNFVLEASNGRGLLGCTQKANTEFQYIRNMIIENAEVVGLEGNDRQAVLFGGVQSALYFENVYIGGSIDCVNGGAFVGKLLGSASATFKNCVSAVTVKDKTSAAGFVGVIDPADANVMNPENPEEVLAYRICMENCAFYGTLSSENTAAIAGTVNGEVLLQNCVIVPEAGDNRFFFNAENAVISADCSSIASSAVWSDGTDTGITAVTADGIRGGAWEDVWFGWIQTEGCPMPESLAEMMGIEPYEEILTVTISTADEFATFFNDLHSGIYTGVDMLVTLEADIDLGNQVLQTNPAGVFNGDFDGKGNKISNFILEASNGRGLLGCSQKANTEFQYIRNLIIENAEVVGLEGNDRQAVLFGGVQSALYFENVYIGGSIDCTNGGAFVGKLFGSGTATFKNCVSSVTLKDKPSSAGFVGVADLADANVMDPADPDESLIARVRMENCAFYGSLSSENNAAFVGTVNGEVELKNCISMPAGGENRMCVNMDNTTINSTDVIENAENLQALNWDGWRVSGEYLLPASVAELLAD